jgi:hypothetical protein
MIADQCSTRTGLRVEADAILFTAQGAMDQSQAAGRDLKFWGWSVHPYVRNYGGSHAVTGWLHALRTRFKVDCCNHYSSRETQEDNEFQVPSVPSLTVPSSQISQLGLSPDFRIGYGPRHAQRTRPQGNIPLRHQSLAGPTT